MRSKLLAIIVLAIAMTAHAVLATETDAAVPAKAKPGWCGPDNHSWHFYCDDPDQDQPDKNAKTQTAAPPPAGKQAKPEDQRAALKAVQDELARLKANMVMDPTPANIEAYIRFQRVQLDRAGMVSDVWRRVLWQNPDIDYLQQRPQNTIGKRTWVDARNLDRATVMEHLNERYGVFFVFRSDCPYCHAMSPVLLAFARKYGITVVPISTDGGPLPEWPNYVIDHGQLQQLGLAGKPVPALMLWDNQTKTPIAVGFGAMSQEEIETRIYALVREEVGHDY